MFLNGQDCVWLLVPPTSKNRKSIHVQTVQQGITFVDDLCYIIINTELFIHCMGNVIILDFKLNILYLK